MFGLDPKAIERLIDACEKLEATVARLVETLERREKQGR